MKGKYRLFMVLTMILFLVCPVTAEEEVSFAGTWSGAIDIMGQELGIDVRLHWDEEKGYSGDMDIPLQGAMGIPLDGFVVEDREIQFAMMGIPGDPYLELTLLPEKNKLTGLFHQSGAAFPVELITETEEDLLEAQEIRQEQKEDIIAFVKQLLEKWQVPGAAVGVLYDGEVVLSQGFGYADQETGQEVDSQTLFAIGSSTKAFATASVALMVEEGAMGWDVPVWDYLPGFRMYDDQVTLKATPRDFALHRTGLSRHDFSWYGRDLEREDIIESMAHLTPGADFRETFIYNNHGYALLGYLAGEVAGMKWEELVRERFLHPLGMDNTNFDVESLQKSSNHARPYDVREGEIQPMEYRNLDALGPAGSMNSTVEDMLHWLEMFIQGGTFGGQEILSPMSIQELTRPQMAFPPSGYPEMRFANYGLGWMIDDYRGHVFVHHGGNIDGYSALMAMIPREQLGIVVLTNRNNSVLPSLATYYIIDRMTDMEPLDWSGRMEPSMSMLPEDSIRPPRQVEGTEPSRDLSDYAGVYEHPGYGEVQVLYHEDQGRLEFLFRGQKAPMEHWHYDVFAARITGMAISMNLPVHFLAGVDGYISSLALPLDPSVAPIEFSLMPGEELKDEAYLQTFTGSYVLMGMELTVRTQEGRLILDIPGQASLILIPQRPNRFAVEDLPGYGVEFMKEEGEIQSFWIDQPHGSFQAEKKE